MKLLLLTLLCTVSHGKETIKYAAIIFRHGDRTPVDTYPTDPWRNESLWPVKFGELTNTGKMQHYALGKWIRKRYSHLLSDKFDPTEIYVRSTDVDRTLMSAQANLAGMYPPVGKAIWNDNLMWQPIPVHTEPERLDEVLAMKKKCAAYDREMEKYINSKAYKDRLSQYNSLMEYLTKHTGKKIKDYNDIDDIYSILYIEALYNFTLPYWTHSVFPDRMKEPAGYSFSTTAATPLLARLSAGPLLKEIVSKMSKASCSTSYLKLSMFSGHDITISTMLTALGMFDMKCPVYTATILFELLHDDATNDYHVQISYRNSTEIVEPYVLDIPSCGKKCPLPEFKKIYEHLLAVNFDYDCTHHNQFNGLLGVSFLIGLVMFVTIYLIHKICYVRISRENARLNTGYSNLHIAASKPVKVVPL